MKKSILIFFLLTIILSVSKAQSTFLYSFKTDQYGGPSKTVSSGNKLFFSAYDPLNGRELWCTDGTASGTHMVKDIYPGTDGGLNYDYFELTSYDLNGVIYFRGDDGIFGSELWRSDGTSAGTYMVQDITSGSFGSGVGYFASVGNILYFTANVGTQLWRSNGTTAGTYAIKSFSIITNLAAFNGNLYFAADDANSGQELWKSDGTTVGTHLLKDLNGVFGASLPCNFRATSNALYFMANTNEGWELWKTTGTNASTVLVKDINPGGSGSVMSVYSDVNTTNIDSIIYFGATDGVNGFQLWKSNGTDAGTVRLTNLANGIDTYSTFPVVDGSIMVNNYALNHWWRYDPVTDSSSETNYPSYPYFNSYSRTNKFIGNLLVYGERDTVFGCEMWQSDGTLNGNRKIQEMFLTDNWNTYNMQGFNSVFGAIGSNLLFTLARNPYNTEIPLYVYDSTNPQTCFAPSIIVPTVVSDTLVHFIWNRIENTTDYEFRYRESGTTTWNTLNTTFSYITSSDLDTATDYEYQLRAFCNGSWTNWSDTRNYNSTTLQSNFILNILAERSESSTVERIYWSRTPQIPSIKIRYRPYGTTTWNNANNATGMKRLTGLLPNTFYEYQCRADWDIWPGYYNYFVTEDINTAVAEIDNTNFDIAVFPNPSRNILNIAHAFKGEVEFELYDKSARKLLSEKLIADRIDVSALSSGVYFLRVKAEAGSVIKKIVLE